MLIDSAMRAYANLNRDATDRNQFVSAIEMLYVALTPRMKEEDRKILMAAVSRLRILVDDVDKPVPLGAPSRRTNLTNLRREAFATLTLLNLFKARKGLGIETKEMISSVEVLAHATDTAEEIEAELKVEQDGEPKS